VHMNKILLGISSILLLFVSSMSHAELEERKPALDEIIPAIDAMVTLPGSDIKAVEARGRVLYMTANGRFVFTEAKLYDTWNRRFLSDMSEIQSWSDRINMERIGLDLNELGSLTYGSGSKKFVMWLDPLCSVCSKALKQLPDLADEYQFELLVVPFLGSESASVVRQFLCARDQGMPQSEQVAALIDHDFSSLPAASKSCNTESVEKLIVTGRVMGIEGVPYIIAPDGRFKLGLPSDGDLSAWLSAGEGA